MKQSALTLLLVFVAAGCATSSKVQVVQVGDSKMSCAEIVKDLEKLNGVEEAINGKKGMTGTNVASFLFWLPGLAYTYYDAGQALEAISDRRSHLTKLYNDKEC